MPTELLSEIVIDAFAKIDIRIGTVTQAERVPKSEKLLKLEVSFGDLGARQIVAGIGRDYDPEKLPGVQVLAVVNLVKRAVMGVESQGMVIAAKNEDGKLFLAQCPGGTDGSRVG